MPAFRDGTVNILGIVNPGVYVDQILPTPFLTGVPTNIEGVVGVGQWGPVGSAQFFSTPDDCAAIFGVPQVRTYDLPSYVQTAVQQGTGMGFCGVRVTDGQDAAATATVQSTGGTMTARYTGSRGNQIGVTFQSTPMSGAYAAIVSFPGRQPERFDNIMQALQSVTVVPGTGYTSVPAVTVSDPQAKVGGIKAQVNATLKVISATVGAGGTGYVTSDTVTLANGVILTVTASAGVVTAATVTNPGSLASGNVPTNPVPVVSTSGSGTNATFTLVWGLGAPTIVSSGAGYSSMTLTLSSAGGTGGTYTPVTSFWAALAYAINNGTPQRGRSKYVVFTAGSSTTAPTLNTSITLSGGKDGASGVTTAIMVGSDVLPRTGMYALRSTKCDAFALADVTDPTTWAAQLAFAISESMLAVTATASSDTIANAITTRTTNGIDDPSIWILEGDYPTVYDATNGLSRLVSPQAVALGLLGNLSPEQSPINKRLNAVIATQTSQTGVMTSDADEAQAQEGGIDFIGKSNALDQDFFSFMTGRNASSNTAARGIEYTRLTNFIIKSLEGSAARSIVGKLQSVRADDPTRAKASAILNSFFAAMKDPASGSDGYGMIDDFAVQCDLNNNPPNLQALGFLFAYCTVRYLNVVRYFVIKLAGGGNVSVSVQQTQPTIAQFS